MSKRIAIFGSSGFVGRSLVRRLATEGIPLVCVQRSAVDFAPGQDVAVHTVPDTQRETLRAVLASYEVSVIINVASYGVHPADRDASIAFDANVRLPCDLVKVARECGASIVHAGSASEYAAPGEKTAVTEDAPLQVGSLYGGTKAAGMIAAHVMAVALSVPFTGLRFFNIYGPGEAPHRLFPSLFTALAANQHVKLSDGLQVRDFVHIDDVTRVIKRAAEVTGTLHHDQNILNVATGRGHSVREVAIKVCDAIRANRSLLAFGDLPRRQDDIPWIVGSPKRAESLLGWSAAISLDRGIATMLPETSEQE